MKSIATFLMFIFLSPEVFSNPTSPESKVYVHRASDLDPMILRFKKIEK